MSYMGHCNYRYLLRVDENSDFSCLQNKKNKKRKKEKNEYLHKRPFDTYVM